MSNKVAFFLGAGASREAGVPDTVGLKKEFEDRIRRVPSDNANFDICSFLDKLGKWAEAQEPPRTMDIELVLEALQRLTDWKQDPALGFLGLETEDLLQVGLEPAEWLRSLQDFIKERVVVDARNIAYLEPLRGFIDVFHPLDIFSANYDTAIEVFCAEHKLKCRDGFDEAWNPKVFDDPDLDVRLFKLHGSVTWYRSDRGRFLKIPVLFKESSVELITKEHAELLMFYPAQKFGYVEPLFELMLQMKQRLSDCGTLVAVGYSFRDEHIRRILWDIARERPDFRMVLIDPDAGNIYRKRLRTYEDGAVLSPLAARVICLPFLFGRMFPALLSEILYNLQESWVQTNEQFSQEHKGLGLTTDWSRCIISAARGGDYELLRLVFQKHERLEKVPCAVLLESIIWGLFGAAANRDHDSTTFFWDRFRTIMLSLVNDFIVRVDTRQCVLQVLVPVSMQTPVTTPNSITHSDPFWFLDLMRSKLSARLQWMQEDNKAKTIVCNILKAIMNSSIPEIWSGRAISFDNYLLARETARYTPREQLKSILQALKSYESFEIRPDKSQPEERETVNKYVKQIEKTIVCKIFEKFDSQIQSLL